MRFRMTIMPRQEASVPGMGGISSGSGLSSEGGLTGGKGLRMPSGAAGIKLCSILMVISIF